MQSKLYILVILISLFASATATAQSSFCDDVEPFCAGDERLTFPNSNYQNSNQTSGELGPDYGCLEEQPYPAWFYLQIEEAGDLVFSISQYTNQDLSGPPLDVDFVVWGPFEKGEEFCSAAALSGENIVDCSYLPDAVETMSILGAQANEIYVVVITNFEQAPGYISLQQTNTGAGNGSTDCSILDSSLGDNIAVCGEDEYLLDGTTDEADIFEWYIYNENIQDYELIPGEDGPTLTVYESGDYRLVVRDLIGNNTDMDDVTVTFYENPKIGETSTLYACVEENEVIDLTEKDADLIAPNGNPAQYQVVYYSSMDNLNNDVAITQPQSFPFENGAKIFARVKSLESGCFSESVDFEIGSFAFPEYSLPEITNFCVDSFGNLLDPVTIGSDLGDEYIYEWMGGNNIIGDEAILNINSFPDFSEIELKVIHKATGCEVQLITQVVPVSAPASLSAEISGSDFGDGYVVTGIAENGNNGEFEYRLDNSDWQAEEVFQKVPAGAHVLSAREIHGCGEILNYEFSLVGYPRYFTPNSDGYHDTWNIINDATISVKQLYVFDRYGKLLKQLNPNSTQGWDGTYNGKPLPADDYWFSVEFVNEKSGKYEKYMANFTLIR